MHLTPHARIGQELLNIEKTRGRPVDRVLRSSAAEERAGDRHLGVVDRQAPSALSIVSSTCARPRAGLALAPAKTTSDMLEPRSVFTPAPHHPGEGVDHIRLARPVRTDDAGDARLEPQRRRAREADLNPRNVRVFRCTGSEYGKAASAWRTPLTTMSSSAVEDEFGEPQRDLAFGRGRGIRAVDDVLHVAPPPVAPEIAADRPLGPRASDSWCP